jgi:hypothetical protein
MKKMKFMITVGLFFAVCIFLFYSDPAVRSQEKENHCFTCHTNPRKLIEITREIARASKDKPGASIATEGEG